MRAQTVCARGFAETHPEDAARLIEQYAASESAAFFEQLPADSAAGVIERMSPAMGADCLAAMSPARGAAALTALPPRVAVALLRRMTPAQQDTLLSTLPADTTDRLRRLLSYREDTVGSITDPGVLALPQDLSVGEALRQLRRHHATAHHHVYVVDRTQRLVGVLHIRDLLSESSKATLTSIMRSAHISLTATTRLTTAAVHPGWREVDTLPVSDDTGVLLGMVRYRQLRQLEAMAGPGSLADTLLGLGELYWMGLSTFLPVIPKESPGPTPTPEWSERGDDHG
ncbi:MAG: CBS domain-containing protein [Gemmatimonadota bacterium]|nr:CBS domain-containing protein [Gemmatimonadota bacterium]